MRSKSLAGLAVVAGLLGSSSTAAYAVDTPVYLETVTPAASLRVLMTAGDSINGYQLPGIPDGIGLRLNGSNLQILMNHEISSTVAANKRIGGAVAGSTVSSLTYNLTSGQITGANEAIKKVTWYDYETGTYGSKAVAPLGAALKDSYGVTNHSSLEINRFCSAYLVGDGELAYTQNGVKYGYSGAVYFTGEEGGDESRAFALNMDGELVQLGAFGLAAWENIIHVPTNNRTSAFMLNEDGSASGSQLFMYVGQKETPTVTTTKLVNKKVKVNGKWVTRQVKQTTSTSVPWYQSAGLTNGKYYVMKIGDYKLEKDFRAAVGKNVSTPVTFNTMDARLNGRVQNDIALLAGTALARVEDGAFDPNNPNDYYFVTTESNGDAKATAQNPALSGVKRDGGALWRLRFNDVRDPLAGASITMLLDGSEDIYLNKPDNLTIDSLGNILIQEDPGNNDQRSRVVAYRIRDGKTAVIAQFKAAYFDKTQTDTFITIDEESSGISDATKFLKSGSSDTASYYILNAQIHSAASKARPDIVDAALKTALDLNVVEGGQLYVLKITNWSSVYGG